MSAAITTLGKLAVADAADFGTNPLRLDFADFDPGVSRDLRDMNGTRGKYDKDAARVRENRVRVEPRLRCEPTALELATLLQWALGGTPTGSGTVTYPLGDAVPTKHVRFDPNQGLKWQAAGVAVDALVLSSSSGEPLAADLELLGQTYSNPSDSFPALSLDVTTQPFILSDCVLTWNSTARQIRDLSLAVRNNLDRGRFLNSLTLTALVKLARQVVWSVELPSGDYDSLWDSGIAGASLSAVFTNGSTALTLTSAAVKFPPRNPMHPFQGEGMLRLEGEAYSSDGSAASLVVTLDGTP